MTFLQRLLRVEIAAQVALVGFSLLFAVVFVAIDLSTSGSATPDTATSLQATFVGGAWIALFAYLYTVGAVALLIAPVYTFIEARGLINLATVALVGSIPGAAVLFWSATSFSLPSALVALKFACLVTGISVAFGIYLVRTWRTEQGSAA